MKTLFDLNQPIPFWNKFNKNLYLKLKELRADMLQRDLDFLRQIKMIHKNTFKKIKLIGMKEKGNVNSNWNPNEKI